MLSHSCVVDKTHSRKVIFPSLYLHYIWQCREIYHLKSISTHHPLQVQGGHSRLKNTRHIRLCLHKWNMLFNGAVPQRPCLTCQCMHRLQSFLLLRKSASFSPPIPQSSNGSFVISIARPVISEITVLRNCPIVRSTVQSTGEGCGAGFPNGKVQLLSAGIEL